MKISACHCRECQRRTGSAFEVAVYWMPEFRKDLVAVALGCFEEPSSLVPTQSVDEESRMGWVALDLRGGD
ncbi:hypothetical protein [Rhizobium leguminosarum]|uniref:hypothetical protein n=1 Tax=Rhizobium leguminosarum TaxID=384 RepID=UPI001FDEB62A|nr:hypothetical protein [Rhizobium leguminosarum]